MTDFIRSAHALGAGPSHSAITDADEIARLLAAPEPAWLHLVADHPGTDPWIEENLGYLAPPIRAALTQLETRPRAKRIDDGLLVVLRGINTDPEADPEDMISLRLWVDASRIVSLSRRRLASVIDIAALLEKGQGPVTAGQFLAELVEQLTLRIETQVNDMDRRTELLEASVVGGASEGQGAAVSDLRLELIDLRQFLAPQRDALRAILMSNVAWLEDGDSGRISEQVNRMDRVVEELEATRDQLQAIRDELNRAMDEQLNRNLYILSVISAVFLPLGFLTGLMGINLGGMPGADWRHAFWVFTGGLGVLCAVIVALMWWLRLVKLRR